MNNIYRQAVKEFGPVGMSYVFLALSAWLLLMICCVYKMIYFSYKQGSHMLSFFGM